MSETKRIDVAEASEGFGSAAEPGTTVSLPVVELLTGRGFVTGKSGSGKSNSASVIAEKLLDNGFGLLIVDIDGEYYGLKEEYEILHAGADEECDIQITADHADKLASLALEQNVPIILDVSSYLDEDEAAEILTAVARSLFAKAKKQKQPFLLLVEEVHEYIPENGSIGECGRMLIKIGKRGRKHGLGICGISQRPADVKKDFITQCDWLLWHRLTWNNDTNVVARILDGEYASAVEDLGDGEGFLMTDWADAVQRVQFYRKQTFDAGATPGLDDFERPDLKSVSDDLVSELEAISDEERRTADRIAELREQLDEKNSRIAELERELQDARDLSRMAEQFVEAMVEEVNGPQVGRTERERMRESRIVTDPPHDSGSDPSKSAEATQADGSSTPETNSPFDGDGFAAAMVEVGNGEEPDASDSDRPAAGESTDSAKGGNGDFAFAALAGAGDDQTENGSSGESGAPAGDSGVGAGAVDSATTDGGQSSEEATAPGTAFSAEAIESALSAAREFSVEDVRSGRDAELSPREQIERSKAGASRFVTPSVGDSTARQDGDHSTEQDEAPAADEGNGDPSGVEDSDATTRLDGQSHEECNAEGDAWPATEKSDSGEAGRELSASDIAPEYDGDAPEIPDDDETPDGIDHHGTGGTDLGGIVKNVQDAIAGLPRHTREMLAVYERTGPETPLNVHFSVGGMGDRTEAYAHNRRLRTMGVVDHVARGEYDYRLREYLAETFEAEGIDVDERRIEASAETIEAAVLPN